MTGAENENLTPREATPGATSELFSFERIRSGATTSRFYPGVGTRLRFANRDVDTLEMPGVPSGYLAAGDVVTVKYKGVCVFRGDVATIAETQGRGDDATQTVTCVGPWSKMQRLVYRQYWSTANGYQLSSRLILNQYQTNTSDASNGQPQNLNSELYEIASHGAAACGYTVALADVDVSTQTLPFDECRDITVADAIRRELRFFPKAICRFDYSGATPSLKIKETASPSTAAYVASIPKTAREYVYTTHPITGVDLEIEATGTVDGVEYRQISHQTAGDTAAGNPDCLYATLQIRGASSNTVRQTFKSVTEAIPGDLNSIGWWKQKHPRLANVALAAIKSITEGARSPSNYSRISAATAGELEEAGLGCEVSKFTCKVTIETEDDKEEDLYLTAHFLTTNATGTAEDPKTYTWVTDSSSESGETVPTGLAAAILAERSGSLVSEKFTMRLGDALPTLGDAIVESDGTVFLQSFEVDCARLTAELSFGVPEHLAPEDMASLLSGFRNKCTTTSATMRKTGKADDGGAKVELGGIPPLSSTEFAPGTKSKTTVASSSGSGGSSKSILFDTTGEKPKLVITDGAKTISLDLADVAQNCGGSYSLHEFKYLDQNGDEQIYHGLFCDDIDLSDIQAGKTIKDVNVSPSSSETTVTFTYSDDTFTEIHIPHGLKGDPGGKGDDGDTPEITAETENGVTHIYADGDLIATLFDGHTPAITASKSNGVTTIYADGKAIAQIADGSEGSAELPDIDAITGISFSISGGKIVANLTKTNIKTGAVSSGTENVCDVGELDVVTEESYSTSTHQFTNVRKRIKVIGTPANATGQAPFTATPLSGE